MYRQKIYRSETKVVDAKTGRVRAIVSDESVDRGGDVIRQSGWVLEDFLRHPILLASHDYLRLRSQIGEWEDMTVVGKKLVGTARYYVGEGNADADWGFNLAAKGVAAYSVGFIDLETEDREGGGHEFLKQELLEVSHVTIPANANALQLMVKDADLHPVLADLAREALANNGGQQKAGRIMSQTNLDKLHRTMEQIDDIHKGVCDMGEGCPAKAIAAPVLKPFPNEHACRLRDPDDFQDDSFRRVSREHEGKRYDIILGRLQGQTKMTEQAYRYPKEVWEAAEARTHCRDHDGSFEAAKIIDAKVNNIETTYAGALLESMKALGVKTENGR